MKKNHLSLYLKTYAEEQALVISRSIPERLQFKHALVIPAYDETIDFLEQLQRSELSQSALLVILIINQPSNRTISIRNQTLWDNSQKIGEVINTQHDHHLSYWQDTNTYLLAVDCFSEKKQLPPKQAVGLARKIGCDIACALIDKKIISHHWVHTSDADTQLPNDYLKRTPSSRHHSACVYPFKHVVASNLTDNEDSETTRILGATLLYETALHYYINGLAYAGSSYAYHSLGSCIAFNADYYAQARGFPKRAAGEDFYLLNKLKKLADIEQLSGKPLLINTRVSNRAPFGTGPAVENIITEQLHYHNFLYYNPKVFDYLKEVLHHFELLFSAKSNLDDWLKKLPRATQEALTSLGIQSLFSHIETQVKNNEQCRKQTQDWFDAFKTLKFIHCLEPHFEKIALEEGITRLLKMTQADD